MRNYNFPRENVLNKLNNSLSYIGAHLDAYYNAIAIIEGYYETTENERLKAKLKPIIDAHRNMEGNDRILLHNIANLLNLSIEIMSK